MLTITKKMMPIAFLFLVTFPIMPAWAQEVPTGSEEMTVTSEKGSTTGSSEVVDLYYAWLNSQPGKTPGIPRGLPPGPGPGGPTDDPTEPEEEDPCADKAQESLDKLRDVKSHLSGWSMRGLVNALDQKGLSGFQGYIGEVGREQDGGKASAGFTNALGSFLTSVDDFNDCSESESKSE